jgi:hypothetical protein
MAIDPSALPASFVAEFSSALEFLCEAGFERSSPQRDRLVFQRDWLWLTVFRDSYSFEIEGRFSTVLDGKEISIFADELARRCGGRSQTFQASSPERMRVVALLFADYVRSCDMIAVVSDHGFWRGRRSGPI